MKLKLSITLARDEFADISDNISGFITRVDALAEKHEFPRDEKKTNAFLMDALNGYASVSKEMLFGDTLAEVTMCKDTGDVTLSVDLEVYQEVTTFIFSTLNTDAYFNFFDAMITMVKSFVMFGKDVEVKAHDVVEALVKRALVNGKEHVIPGYNAKEPEKENDNEVSDSLVH